MGREGWVNWIQYFVCLGCAGLAISLDAWCSYSYIHGILQDDIAAKVATVILAGLASSVGGILFFKDSWINFTYRIPQKIAGISEAGQRISEIIGVTISGLFLMLVVVASYWVDIVSNRAFFTARKVDATTSLLAAIIVVLASDALFVIARSIRQQIKLIRSQDEDFNAAIKTGRKF